MEANETYFIRTTDDIVGDIARGESMHMTPFDTIEEAIENLPDWDEDRFFMLDDRICYQLIGICGEFVDEEVATDEMCEDSLKGAVEDNYRQYGGYDGAHTYLCIGDVEDDDIEDGDVFSNVRMIKVLN